VASKRRESAVARHRVVLVVAVLLFVQAAHAQSPVTGLLSGQLGAAQGGDVRDTSLAVSASMAVIEKSGLGAELDLGHVRGFDSDFASSGITTLMVNFVGYWPHERIRPFGSAGVGLLRVRASFGDGSTMSRTDWGLSAGGGVFVVLNEAFGVRGDLRYFRHAQRQLDLPLVDSGPFDYWRASVGATFMWPMR